MSTPKKAASKVTKGSLAKPAGAGEVAAAAPWIESVVKPEGLLGLRLGETLEAVVKALKAKDEPSASGPSVVVTAKVGGRHVTATVGPDGLSELAVFIAHKPSKEAEHKAVAKELKAFLTARHGKPGGRPSFPEWQVAGEPAYRLWMCSWKTRGSDFGDGELSTKVVMDVHVG